MPDYTPTIGIETHVQLKTKTKLFAAVDNDARDAKPNTLISHICVGMPGALPVLNKRAVELACRAAFVLKSEPQKFSKFDRKHYFYPDLPKGYQVSQYEQPIILGGHVEISVGGETKKIGIVRAHLEEDAGKNTHPEGADYSLVDLNRAGTPLLEIVSEPQINSAAEAKTYARELYLLMKYAGVSDVDMYHGNLRFDVNVSLSSDPAKLGTRAEVKNLNSFRSVEAAVEYEIKRQSKVLDNGEKVTQETRGWDEATQKTTPQRGKEEAQDYRYMPEPDVPPIEFTDEQLLEYKKGLPILPGEWRKILNKSSISEPAIEILLERNNEHGLDYLAVIEKAQKIDNDLSGFIIKYIVNDYFKLTSEVKKQTSGAEPAKPYLPSVSQFEAVYQMQKSGQLSSSSVVSLLFNARSQDDNLPAMAEKMGLVQVSDEAAIEALVTEVLAENAKAARDVRGGETKAIGFLVGQVMAKSKGSANPGLAQEVIKKQLGI